MNESERREMKYRKINILLLPVMGLIAGGCVLSGLRTGDHYAAFQAALALIMFTFPAAAARFLHFNIPGDSRLIYYMFTFATIVVGSAMYGYGRIPYWDKFLHFLSGILISALGLIVCHMFLGSLEGTQKARRTLYLLFPFLFNLSVAAIWEIYEYLLYILLGIDAVNNLTTGVHDTMQDIIVCFLGGILFAGLLLRAFLKGRPGFLLNVCTHFFAMRGQKLEL